MKDIIEITFFSLLSLVTIPCIIYIWVYLTNQILEEIDYYYSIKSENSELREEIIARDEEIHYLKEHIKNS